jgi:hypothetical protein
LRATVAAILILMLGACQEYRIEYHDRPAFYADAMEGGPGPDRVTMPDGTIVVFRDKKLQGNLQKEAEGTEAQPFLPREELEDGSIILRAILPEHVLYNTLACIREHDYELLWDQMLAQETRDSYVRRGEGLEEFGAFIEEHRNDLGKTVNRMFHGLVRNEVVADKIGAGVVRYRFIPQIGKQFKFKSVTMVNELDGMKLVVIQ